VNLVIQIAERPNPESQDLSTSNSATSSTKTETAIGQANAVVDAKRFGTHDIPEPDPGISNLPRLPVIQHPILRLIRKRRRRVPDVEGPLAEHSRA